MTKWIVIVFLTAVNVISQVLPTDVRRVFGGANGHNDAFTVVYFQFGSQYNGLTAIEYIDGSEEIICERVIPFSENELHLAMHVDAVKGLVVTEITTGLGAPLGFAVFDIRQNREVARYSETRFIRTVADGPTVLIFEKTTFIDSMQVVAVNAVSGDRHPITVVDTGLVARSGRRMLVVGSRLMLLRDVDYELWDIDSSKQIGTDLLSNEMRESVDSRRNVVDRNSNLVFFSYSDTSNLAMAFDVYGDSVIVVPLDFQHSFQDARLVFCDKNNGCYVFSYEGQTIREVFVVGSQHPALTYETFGSASEVTSIEGTGFVVLRTNRAVVLGNVKQRTWTDVATSLGPSYIDFVGDESPLFITDPGNAALFDYSARSFIDYAPTIFTEANSQKGFTYSCIAAGSGTNVSIDAQNQVGSEARLIELQRITNCGVLAITDDTNCIISVYEDSVRIFNANTSAASGTIQLNPEIGELRDVYAGTDSSALFVVGSTASMHIKWQQDSLYADVLPDVLQLNQGTKDSLHGAFYRGHSREPHLLFRPKRNTIGDCDISTGIVTTFDPINKQIDHVITNENGKGIVIAADGSANWVDFPTKHVLEPIDLQAQSTIMSADYSFKRNKFAYKTRNRIVIQDLPITSVEWSEANGEHEESKLTIIETDNAFQVKVDIGAIHSVSVYGFTGALLARVQSDSRDNRMEIESTTLNRCLPCMIVADVLYAGQLMSVSALYFNH